MVSDIGLSDFPTVDRAGAVPGHVAYWGQSRQHVLTVSISGNDPIQTWPQRCDFSPECC